MSYNGWRNYETWNVALWLQNDETLYGLARHYAATRPMYERPTYLGLQEEMDMSGETPDGVSWLHPDLDLAALDEMMGELSDV